MARPITRSSTRKTAPARFRGGNKPEATSLDQSRFPRYKITKSASSPGAIYRANKGKQAVNNVECWAADDELRCDVEQHKEVFEISSDDDDDDSDHAKEDPPMAQGTTAPPQPATPPKRRRTAGPRTLASDIVARNGLLILELEQKQILDPGVLTVLPSGELRADLSTTLGPPRPDQGTMAGLYPGLAPPRGLEHQIPSWLRDCLVRELDVFGRGPPACCAALYDHCKKSSGDALGGTNTTVSTARTLASYGAVSLRAAVGELSDFVRSAPVFGDTYALEFASVAGTVRRLVGCGGGAAGEEKEKKMPSDIELLLDVFGRMDMGMKGVLDEALEDLVIGPCTRLVERLDLIAEGLRRMEDMTCQEEEEEEEEARAGGGGLSDSGISGLSP